MRIREATKDDKKYVMSWIKYIWGGHDYIPYVWDRWLRDPVGTLYVVEEKRKPIAIWHIKWLKEIAWLEGMRVKKEFRNKGVATLTARYSIKLAKEKGYKSVMLSTSSKNIPALRVMEKLGFKNVSKYYKIESSITEKYVKRKKAKRCINWDYLTKKYFRLSSNNFIIGYSKRPWMFTKITEEEVLRLKKRRRLYVSESWNAIAIIGRSFRYKKEKTCYIRYLDGYNNYELNEIAEILIEDALKTKCSKIYGYIPTDTELVKELNSIGINVDTEKKILVYQYNI